MTLKKGRLKEIVTELQGASKMHLKQSKEIAAHIDDMSPAKMTSPLNKEVRDHTNTSCWDDKVKIGTKMSSTNPGVKVNDCVDPSSPRAKNK